jgi:hypothetical protein
MVRMAGEARFTGFALAWIFKAVRDHSTPNGFETAWFHRPKRAARDDVHGRNGRQYRGGLVKIGEWRRLLTRARRKGYFLGVRETRYPRDFATFVRFETALRNSGCRSNCRRRCRLRVSRRLFERKALDSAFV